MDHLNAASSYKNVLLKTCVFLIGKKKLSGHLTILIIIHFAFLRTRVESKIRRNASFAKSNNVDM